MTKFLQGNVRSLNTSSKFVEDLCIKEDIKILCLSEIWHPDVENLNFLQKWKWYEALRLHKEGGGTAIIVRPDVKTLPRKDITGELEMTWCEIFIRDTKVLLGSVYIRPDDAVSMGIHAASL